MRSLSLGGPKKKSFEDGFSAGFKMAHETEKVRGSV